MKVHDSVSVGENTGDLDFLLQGAVAAAAGESTWSNFRVRTGAGVGELGKEGGMTVLEWEWRWGWPSGHETNEQQNPQSRGHHRLGSREYVVKVESFQNRGFWRP